MITARQDVLAVLRGQKPARVPWNIHSGLLQPGLWERELRNAGMGIAEKGVSAYHAVTPHVSVEERRTWELNPESHTNVLTVHITHHTPIGKLQSRKIFSGSAWVQEYPVKTAADLRVLEFITNDAAYYPNYEGVTGAQKRLGDDGIVVCRMLRSPLQRLLIEWMGIEGVCYAFADFPDEMNHVLGSMASADETMLQITAQSPAQIVWSAENLTSSITPPHLYTRYSLPYYNHCAAALHAQNKWYGVHMDGMLATLKQEIAQTDFDFIEAFTPPPMGDLNLVEALSLWPGKVIWANFPGNVFHSCDEDVIAYALQLLETGLASGRFMLTFSEDIPNMERSLSLVARAVTRYEKQHC